MFRIPTHMMRFSLVVVALALAGCGGEDVPKTADQAVLRVANGLAENKPVVIWDALPNSYQKDVHDLVHTAVGKVDPDVWNQAFTTAQRVAKVLREKKQFILGHEMVAAGLAEQGVDKAEAEKQWDTVVTAVEALVNSEIASFEKAKAIDLGAFLDRTGSKIMEGVSGAAKSVKGGGEKPGEPNEIVMLFEKLKQTKATLVKEEGDKATVKMEVPGEAPKDTEFVRVEGKWIPKDMANEWSKSIGEAKKQIDSISTAEMQQQKQAIQMGLTMVGVLIEPLEKAKTQAEFNAAVASIFQMMQGGGNGPGPRPPTDDDTPGF